MERSETETSLSALQMKKNEWLTDLLEFFIGTYHIYEACNDWLFWNSTITTHTSWTQSEVQVDVVSFSLEWTVKLIWNFYSCETNKEACQKGVLRTHRHTRTPQRRLHLPQPSATNTRVLAGDLQRTSVVTELNYARQGSLIRQSLVDRWMVKESAPYEAISHRWC